MMWGDWTHPLALVLLGAVLVVVGLISWDRSCGPLAPGARGIAVLRTEARFKDGIVRFRLRAVQRDSSEAWYQEAGRIPSGDVP